MSKDYKTKKAVKHDVSRIMYELGYFSESDYADRVLNEWGGNKKTLCRDMIKTILHQLEPENPKEFIEYVLKSYLLERGNG